MSANRAENEGVRLLDEFVCQAVRYPCVLAPKSAGSVASRGENEGIRISEEAVSACGPQPIDVPSKRIACFSESELRSLSTAQLFTLVQQLSSDMVPSQLALIREIVTQRLARCREEIALGSELIATCNERARRTGDDA
ncbi:MAG: hypothetical protein HUU20_06100 [Pirellulales bacterium]|nr:hypothetical protein [Pirellulales bacterium]